MVYEAEAKTFYKNTITARTSMEKKLNEWKEKKQTLKTQKQRKCKTRDAVSPTQECRLRVDNS